MNDPHFLRNFYRALADRPLEPDDSCYVDLYHDPALAPYDPVAQLASAIEWLDEGSTHLFSGFRGTGKSTELRRLRAHLQRDPRTKVVLCDMSDTLNLSAPVDITDFLIAVAGAFGDALRHDERLLGDDVSMPSYWTRVVDFLTRTEVDVKGLALKGPAGMGLQTNLRRDPTFRDRLRERMSGHLGALIDDVHAYLAEGVAALRGRWGDTTRVVLLFDSIEQIRGTSIGTAEGVYASVQALFSNHAHALRFADVHAVYTVPPWLKIRSPGIEGDYGGMSLLPCVRVRSRDGRPDRASLDALERLVRRRGDWEALLGTRARLDRLVLASGGYLRDLFRLLQSVLRHARGTVLPVDDDLVAHAIAEVRSSYLPLAREDALWLAEIQGHQSTGLAVHHADASHKSLYHLSRFFDTHMVLCYRTQADWTEWYDVHPLLRDEVVRQVGQHE